MDEGQENTNRVVHVFKEDQSNAFSPQGTVLITQQGGLGICVGGLCIVMPPATWHAMAVDRQRR